ncbi:BrnA antitoxin family protein [Roseovarius aestuariivivens]|uniref:BrnA antitoxin family protein n=1 Tax=Roseovarius aestuariivivens TaxID=1888910 RepID=UPI001080A941|nr:BrnA antitoxin family protein [Roseovarius aestuariivivens]
MTLSRSRAMQARIQMMEELRRLQEHLTESWIDQSLPEEWSGMESREPIARAKTRVTIRLDADMVRWFRKLGPGYQTRINQVLRLYWLGLIEGKISAHWDEEAAGPRFAKYLDRQMELLRQQREIEDEEKVETSRPWSELLDPKAWE